MSAHDESDSNAESTVADDAAEAVRKAFAALPFEQKIGTLFRVELDMVGEAVDAVVKAAARAVDEIAETFSGEGQAGAGPAGSQGTPI